jgi:DNA polymerase III epsilon subunit-like protein
LIQPNGWTIAPGAFDVHGIPLDDCLSHGIPIKAALVTFLEMAKQCRVAVAYSFSFDNWFVRAELKRLQSDDPGLDRPGLRHIDPHKISGTLADDGKWMKLRALHELLTGWDYPEAHDGLADSRACLRCLRVMVERKLVEL